MTISLESAATVDEHLVRYLITAVQRNSLNRGRSHAAGTMNLDGRCFFVKLCLDPRRLPRLVNEYRWMQTIYRQDHDLVPEPLAFIEPGPDDVQAILVTEGIDGSTLSNLYEDSHQSRLTLLEQYGGVLAHLHRLPVTSTTITFDGECWPDWRTFIVSSVERYLADIKSLGGVLPVGLEERILLAIQQEQAGLEVGAVGPIHGDPTPSNLLIDKQGQWRWSDLEVAQHGDPLMDLAILGLFWLDERPAAWPSFLRGYGLSLDLECLRRMNLYRLVRLIRLLRGAYWIYRDTKACQDHVHKIVALLDRDWSEPLAI
jgi:aminoglycoside phosphotransferase (APT) family kinase protein